VGDSGGAAYYDKDGKLFVVGIASESGIKFDEIDNIVNQDVIDRSLHPGKKILFFLSYNF
jgi:hypothetical protein